MTTKPDTSPDMARRALAYRDTDALRRDLAQVNASAMQTLLGAVQRAGSLEEIEIVLRYQQARERRTWTVALVEQILKDLRTSADGGATDEERAKRAAQQLGLIVRVHRAIAEERDGREEGRR